MIRMSCAAPMLASACGSPPVKPAHADSDLVLVAGHGESQEPACIQAISRVAGACGCRTATGLRPPLPQLGRPGRLGRGDDLAPAARRAYLQNFALGGPVIRTPGSSAA